MHVCEDFGDTVLLCELIGNLSFTLPADSDNTVRVKYAGSLMPTLSSGEKGLMLRVNKIGWTFVGDMKSNV
jgi:hypothetical protein